MMRCALAVCAIFKNEAEYLGEWLDFHRLMGVEHFYLYDNGSTDAFMAVLAGRIAEGIVTLHAWPQARGQYPAYEHCLKTHGEEADWIAFIDIDEFLFSPQGRPLSEVLAEYAPYAGVGVNWVMFGTSGHKTKPAGGVLENYRRRGDLDAQIPLPWMRLPDQPGKVYRVENTHIKSIVRPARVAGCHNPHYFRYVEGEYAVDELGRRVDGPFTQSVSVEKLRINHYWSKSEQECRLKFARGMADVGGKRRWEEFLIHEHFLNKHPDDTVLAVVALLAQSRPRLALADFVQAEDDVWQPPGRPAAPAASPEAERIRTLLTDLEDRSLYSPELIDLIQDERVELHLSPRRAHSLRCLAPLPADARVLELGAGAGTVTRALAEAGYQVDAVEASPAWARVAAARVHGLANARVYCASLDELAPSPGYDLVVLLGAPDYAAAWPRTPKPLLRVLELAAQALAPGGSLLLALPNRLGLHALKEHAGHRAGRYASAFARAELEADLRAAGFARLAFHFPFPDSTLPEAVIAEAAFGRDDLHPGDLICALRGRHTPPDAGPAWDDLASQGLLAALAEGFLVLATRPGGTPPARPALLAQCYVDDRAPGLNKVVELVAGDHRVDVREYPIEPAPAWSSDAIVHRWREGPWPSGRAMIAQLSLAAQRGRVDAWQRLLQAWVARLKAQADEHGLLPGDWIDAVPARMWLDPQGDCTYDGGEWSYAAPVDLRLPLYLGLWQLATDPRLDRLPAAAEPRERVRWLCAQAGVVAQADWLERTREIHEAFAREIHAEGRFQRSDRYRHRLSPPSTGDLEIVQVSPYAQWLGTLKKSAPPLPLLGAQPQAWATQPRLLAVVVAGQDATQALERTLASLRAQSYPLAVAVIAPGEVPAEADPAIVWHPCGADWIAAINTLLGARSEDWALLLHAGDELDADAALVLAERVAALPHLRALYSDEDAIADDQYADPIFKPDFNLDLLRSYPYTGRSLAFQRSRCLELGGLAAEHGELAPHDLMFRLIETDGLPAVGHVDEVLYHAGLGYGRWMKQEHVAARCAGMVAAHLTRLGIAHRIEPGALPYFNRVNYLHAQRPLVSIIVPSRDQFPMLNGLVDSLVQRTRYPRYELIIVDNDSREPAACRFLDGIEQLGNPKLRVLRWPHPFNYSAINNFAAAQARGEYLVLLNNDTAVLHEDWLEALLNHAQRPEVGIVGAKLHYPDGKLQHGGVVLGLRGPADHPFIGAAMDAPGYMHRLLVDQNYTAVTAACLMIRKTVYEEVGGLDEQEFKVSYNDVDLCLKVRQAGYLTVWTPYARLMHEGSVSQRKVDKSAQAAKRKRFEGEQQALYRKWLPLLARDPAYNRNLTLHDAGFGLDPKRLLAWQPFFAAPLPRALCHPADATGCGHYRVRQPLAAMQAAGVLQGALTEQFFSPVQLERFDADTLILQRQITEPQIRHLKSLKLLSRAFRVYELDDYLPNVPMKSAHHGQIPKDILKSLRKAVALADRFVVSTEPLAEQFRDLHEDVRVLPNRLPPSWWRGLESRRRIGRKPRVGWAGGISHRGDLELIAEVVRDLAGEVDWVFFGMCPEKLRPYVHEFHAGVAIEKYPAALAALNLDLALAPLEQNLFNECKSNLRLLEYGACGFPVVCSDVAPYRCELPVTRVKNRYKDWMGAIRAHLADLDATAAAGDALREAVLGRWMLEGDNLLAWRRAWLPD